jgi:S1-C subfamily serine protease
MIGSRRAWRILVPVLLGPLAAGISDGRAVADDLPASLSASFRRAAARARASLVSIRLPDGFMPTTSYVPGRQGRFSPSPLRPPFIDRQPDVDSRITFSGLVIDADKGYILTGDHPTHGASQLVVTFPDGHERLTTQVRRDPRSSLALLAVDLQGLHPGQATWGNPAKLEPGDWLIALGQPGVGDPSMSVGVFSTRRRGGGEELLETDAAITRVGAGGILINLNGEVVGICRLGGRRADGFEGMGHAIPADRARRVADDLARFGQVRRAYLGVTVQPTASVNPAGQLGDAGVLVATVGAGTPAAEAGVRPGDVILAVGGRPVNSVGGLQEAVDSAAIGEELILDLKRQGDRMEIKVKLRAGLGPVGPVRTPRPGTIFDRGLDPSQGGPALPGVPRLDPGLPGGPSLSPLAPPGAPSLPPEPERPAAAAGRGPTWT